MPADPAIPLVVDLDGTLVRVDTLHESALAFAAASPMNLLRMAAWLRAGKAGFKARLAGHAIADAAALPRNDAVIALIEAARRAGRAVFLVSAAHQRQVDAVAAAVGLFDGAYGSDAARNLSGPAKAAFLTERFGAGGFDYAGDSAVDLAVWAQARRAISVGADAALRARLERLGRLGVAVEHLAPPPRRAARIATYLKAMRPHQWLKNVLVFVPALAAHDIGALPAAFAAFIAFSILASSVYLINDLLDIGADRVHPRKRRRPFAAGEIPALHGIALSGVLIVLALALALAAAPLSFIVVLGAYLAVTVGYSLYLKRKLFVDVWTLAVLYTLRIVAGGAATGVPLSPWMLGFSMFVFLALAAVKRQAEMTDLERRGLDTAAGRSYRVGDLPVLLGVALASGYNAVLIFALYISSPDVVALYANPEVLWLVCPLLLYWITRMILIAHRGEMDDDPIVFAVRDRVSLGVAGAVGALMVAGTLT